MLGLTNVKVLTSKEYIKSTHRGDFLPEWWHVELLISKITITDEKHHYKISTI